MLYFIILIIICFVSIRIINKNGKHSEFYDNYLNKIDNEYETEKKRPWVIYDCRGPDSFR